jgi:hypothetical protein
VLFHCKPVNQQKTTIFALILWEEQRLNRFWSEKRCRNSTFTLGSKKSVLPSSFNTRSGQLLIILNSSLYRLNIKVAWGRHKNVRRLNWLWMFYTTFITISIMLWWFDFIGGENCWLAVSHCQTWLHNVVFSTSW